jgi:hypothetical protein
VNEHAVAVFFPDAAERVAVHRVLLVNARTAMTNFAQAHAHTLFDGARAGLWAAIFHLLTTAR